MDSSNSQSPGTPVGKIISSRVLRSRVIACSTPNSSSNCQFLLDETQFSLNETAQSAILEENDDSSSSGGFSDSKMITLVKSQTAMIPSLIHSDEISAIRTHKEFNENYIDNDRLGDLNEDNFLLSEKGMKNEQETISQIAENVLNQESQNIYDVPKKLLNNCSGEPIEISEVQKLEKLPSDSGAVGSVINKVKLEDYEIVECSVADSESIDLEIPDVGMLEETSDLDCPRGSNEDSIEISKNLDAENIQPQSNLIEILKLSCNEKLVKVSQSDGTSFKKDVKIIEDTPEEDILSGTTFCKISRNVDISESVSQVSTVIINQKLSDSLNNYTDVVDSKQSSNITDNTLVNEGSDCVPDELVQDSTLNQLNLESSKEILSEVKIESELANNCGGKSNSTLDMEDDVHISNKFLNNCESYELDQNSLDSNKIKMVSDENNEKLDESLFKYAIKNCFNDSSKLVRSFENTSLVRSNQTEDVMKETSLDIENDYKTTNEINNNVISCENVGLCIDSNVKGPSLLDSCCLQVFDEREIINSKKRPCESQDDLVDDAKRGKILDTNNDKLSYNMLETEPTTCIPSSENTSKNKDINTELDCVFKDLSHSIKPDKEEARVIHQSSLPNTDIKKIEKSQYKDDRIEKSACNVFEENKPTFIGSTNRTEQLANNSVCNGRIVKKVIKIGKDSMYYLSRENWNNCSILTNDTFNTVDEAPFDVTGNITGSEFTMDKQNKLPKDTCEISKNNLLKNDAGPSGSITSVPLLKKGAVQRNEADNKSTLNEVSCFTESKKALMVTKGGEVSVSKDAIVDASTCKSNANDIFTDNKTSDGHLCETKKLIVSKPQEFKSSQESKIEDLNKIATEEINKTVTDEDLYYSKKDEISICFDTRSEHLIALDEGPKVPNKGEENSRATTSKRLDVSAIREKQREKIKPPPAKKICLEAPQRPPTDRPLEVFVSNNDCENADNNDPQWQVYKKLTNDELRYECVRKKWFNPQIPNVNSNLSTYNWRARNGLPPLRVNKNDLTSYYSTMGGSVHDIFTKARDNARTLFEQKVRALELKKDQCYNDADEKLHFSLCRSDPKWRYLYYSDYREELDRVENECASQYESLLIGLEERIASIDKSEEEVITVSNFYKGLDATGETSRTRLTPWQLCCWFDREDTLNNYEVFYSENN